LTDIYLILGKVVGTHGLQGGLKVVADRGILSSFPSNLLIQFAPSKTEPEYKIISTSKQKTFVIKIEEINSVEKAELFVGKNIYIEKSKIPAPEKGEFYEFQLIGLIPREKDNLYSDFKIINVIESPAHPLLEFSDGLQTILIPYINRFVGEIDLTKNEIEVIDWQDWFRAL
jgi:16S rRNA processing protein RimM